MGKTIQLIVLCQDFNKDFLDSGEQSFWNQSDLAQDNSIRININLKKMTDVF